MLVELGGDRSLSSEAPPRSQRRRSKGDGWGGATARGAMEMGRSVGDVEKKRDSWSYPF